MGDGFWYFGYRISHAVCPIRMIAWQRTAYHDVSSMFVQNVPAAAWGCTLQSQSERRGTKAVQRQLLLAFSTGRSVPPDYSFLAVSGLPALKQNGFRKYCLEGNTLKTI